MDTQATANLENESDYESSGEHSDGGGSEKKEEHDNEGAHQAMLDSMAEHQKHWRLYRDRHAIITKDWHTLMSRHRLPKRKTPYGVRVHAEDAFRPMDVCYPRDQDLFPKVARCVPTQRSPTSCSTATPRAFSPRSNANSSACSNLISAPAKLGNWGLCLESLNSKISHSRETAARLETAHRSHTSYGFHIEDAGGAELPPGPVMAPAPRSTVLFRCGAMRCMSPEFSFSEPSQLEMESREPRARSVCC